MTKFSMELKKNCKLKKYNNIESKVKKVSGKSKQSWIGITKIIDDDNDDDNSMPTNSLDIKVINDGSDDDNNVPKNSLDEIIVDNDIDDE